MKTQRTLCLLLALGLAVLALGETSVFAKGSAYAAGTIPSANTTRGDIKKDKDDKTGGLTVDKVTVLDNFGRITRTLVKDKDYEVQGDTSTSPSILFHKSANLKSGEFCRVDMISTKDVSDYRMDIEFN